MKIISFIFLPIFILISSAKPFSISNDCPKNGQCTFDILTQKSLNFKKDEFGHLYPEIKKGNQIILKFTYQKNSKKGIVDGNYKEIIYAEIPEEYQELNLKNKALKSIKLHFGRFCYCKENSGYFPIKEGNFQIKKISKSEILARCNFTIKNIPQIITSFKKIITTKAFN